MTMEDFRDQLLRYLFVEKKFNEEEVERQKQMTNEEKVENNLLLIGATIINQCDDVYEMHVPENYSKLRAGDKVTISEEGTSSSADATVIDVYFDTITLTCEKQLNNTAVFTIEQQSPELLQSLISCLEGIYAGVPGAAFLRLLAGESQFKIDDFMKVSIESVPYFTNIKTLLNEEQESAVMSMLQYPPVSVLQGPPGTGKTLVLAATAIATARNNREVVIIANTHHAVNNALMKIRSLDKHLTLIKIGSSLKGEELDNSIINFEKFNEYYEYSYQNRKKKKSGYIVGMTIWSAIVYLGLRHHSHFRPYQALIDEASLMPLSLATILGKTAPSVCLFGDSQQMPPIFRPELDNNELSCSILDYCADKVEGVPINILTKTYRMNEGITDYVSSQFYEPHGIKLVSAGQNKNRKLVLSMPDVDDKRITDIFAKDAPDIVHINPNSPDNICDDENVEEALFAAQVASSAMNAGLIPDDIAIITPYRKQVRAIRSALKSLNVTNIPLVDTVERLQGQDVELIIISFAATNSEYIKEQYTFLYNPNRLNVMVSRAKTKVVLLGNSNI